MWTYACTKTVPSHGAGEMDPLCNVATATGEDEQDKPVTDTDEHCTDILHPAIDLTKRANRETAYVGDTIGYTFDVTNPGDIGLKVTLRPALRRRHHQGPAGDRRRQRRLLEPDEQWRYTCTHKVTASDPDPLPNTAHATGEDPTAATSRTRTRLGGHHPAGPAEGAAQAGRSRAAGARRPAAGAPWPRAAAGPSGCVYRTFRANVRGRQIRRVTFFLDGRRVVVRNGRSGQRPFTARIRPGSLRSGVHRVTARVGSVTPRGPARARSCCFQRCVRLAPSPRFTG